MGTFLTVVMESAAASCPKRTAAQAYQAFRKLPFTVRIQGASQRS